MNENINEERNEEIEVEPPKETSNEPESTYAFKWEYSEQILHDKNAECEKRKKRSKRGMITYGAIMLVAFLVAFGILAASLLLDNLTIGNSAPAQELTVSEIVEKGLPSTVSIVAITGETSASNGSGFVINDYGYIVTNYHVVENSLQISIADYNGVWSSAELIGYEKTADVAVLYSEHAKLKAATLADSSVARLGETVVAIGCPVGSETTLSVSNGIISNFMSQSLSAPAGLIQTNAPLNPGNSGGPLFDSKGNVLGIVTSKLMYTTDVNGDKIPLEGIAYAIPINSVKLMIENWIVNDLQTPKMGLSAVSVEKGYWYFYSGSEGAIYYYFEENGVKYKTDFYGSSEKLSESELSDPENKIFEAYATGICVVGVTKGLGADGKIQLWDIVTELDGQPIKSVTEAKIVFQRFNAGDSIQVKFCRNGEMHTVSMTLKTKGDMLAADRNS